MTPIRFIHHGDPVGKQSIICDCRGKFGRAVQRKETRAYENSVRKTAQTVMVGRDRLEGAVWLRLDIYRRVQSSLSKRERGRRLQGEARPVVKPDCSNVLKSVEDAMNGVVFADDAQVCGVAVRKFYSDHPRVEVSVGLIGGADDG